MVLKSPGILSTVGINPQLTENELRLGMKICPLLQFIYY